MFKVPEKYRIKFNPGDPYYSDKDFGNNGAFRIKSLKLKHNLFCIASDGHDWEHVSVTRENGLETKKTPTWEEMCFVKNLFWDKIDVVVQYHPAENEYVNHHPYCLHLWRPMNQVIFTPPPYLVGPKK